VHDSEAAAVFWRHLFTDTAYVWAENPRIGQSGTRAAPIRISDGHSVAHRSTFYIHTILTSRGKVRQEIHPPSDIVAWEQNRII